MPLATPKLGKFNGAGCNILILSLRDVNPAYVELPRPTPGASGDWSVQTLSGNLTSVSSTAVDLRELIDSNPNFDLSTLNWNAEAAIATNGRYRISGPVLGLRIVGAAGQSVWLVSC